MGGGERSKLVCRQAYFCSMESKRCVREARERKHKAALNKQDTLKVNTQKDTLKVNTQKDTLKVNTQKDTLKVNTQKDTLKFNPLLTPLTPKHIYTHKQTHTHTPTSVTP